MAPETSQRCSFGGPAQTKTLQTEAQGGFEVPRGVPMHDFGPKSIENCDLGEAKNTEKSNGTL